MKDRKEKGGEEEMGGGSGARNKLKRIIMKSWAYIDKKIYFTVFKVPTSSLFWYWYYNSGLFSIREIGHRYYMIRFHTYLATWKKGKVIRFEIKRENTGIRNWKRLTHPYIFHPRSHAAIVFFSPIWLCIAVGKVKKLHHEYRVT